MIKAFTYVRVTPTSTNKLYKQLSESYPAANWIKKLETVRLMEDALNEGTLDVIDVKRENGEHATIYDFNIFYVLPKSMQ